eukprot:TRINITY_DN29635_c0_g1_i1.p1 TRINITY_DN29635_c0_g1~~TRINITY_DN29635_c0_g1_i1.p1  ORF type:complete len:158 (-),score=29.57 TRINITY_DN29635_c0_g1_i1:363-836(-)
MVVDGISPLFLFLIAFGATFSICLPCLLILYGCVWRIRRPTDRAVAQSACAKADSVAPLVDSSPKAAEFESVDIDELIDQLSPRKPLGPQLSEEDLGLRAAASLRSVEQSLESPRERILQSGGCAALPAIWRCACACPASAENQQGPLPVVSAGASV